MKDKRKLDGAVYESLTEHQTHKSDAIVATYCAKNLEPYFHWNWVLQQAGRQAGWVAGRQMIYR